MWNLITSNNVEHRSTNHDIVSVITLETALMGIKDSFCPN